MRSLLEKDGEILMHMLHAVVLNEGDRTVTSLAISAPILKVLPIPGLNPSDRTEIEVNFSEISYTTQKRRRDDAKTSP